MTDAHMPRRVYKGRYTRDSHGVIKIDGNLPSHDELDEAHARHKNDAADRFSLYTPQQIGQLTRRARLDMIFDDVMHIRRQAEMIQAAMRSVIVATRRHKLGTIRQRIEARAEAASCIRALNILNGRSK